MNSVSEEYIKNIIDNVASACDLEQWHCVKQKFEVIAQNYFGVLIPVDLVGKINGEDVSIPVVLKLAPTDERFRVSGALTQFFAREMFVYSTVLEKYKELQQNLPLPHYVVPKCYYICKEYCKEAIVMQNMCREGYKPYTKDMFLDLNHITISLKSLAKFHALSFLLRKRDARIYEAATKSCWPLTEKNNKRFVVILLDRLKKAAEKFKGTEYVTLIQYLEENCVKFVEATADSVEDTCICHGDIWKENILFQYDENNETVSACLIDYQTARISSPAYDVLYLITSSTSSDLRRKHFKELLEVYYKTFDQTLSEAGLDTQTVYGREAFDKDLKTVAPACLIVANTALWLYNGLQEEGHVKSKRTLTTEEEKARAVESYRSTIKGIIDDYIDYNYICTCL